MAGAAHLEWRRGPARALPAIAWAGAIWCLSSQPLADMPPLLSDLMSVDKLAHAVAYCALGALVAFALGRAVAPPARAFAWSAFTAAAYGIVDEVHQSYVPMRMADPFDALADAIGALAGAALITYALAARGAAPKEQGCSSN